MSYLSPALVLVLVGLAAFFAGVGLVLVWIRRERRGFTVELRSLWDRLDAIFYRSPLAISLCEFDPQKGILRVIDCNDQACALHHATRDQMLRPGEREAPIIPDGERERLRAWLSEQDQAKLWHGEKLLPAGADHEPVPVSFVLSRVEIGDRHLVLMVERDLAEQRRAEAALKDSEQRFRQIVENAGCLLWKARVVEVGDKLRWQFDIPLSGLRQRLFDLAGIPFEEGSLWRGFNVPEFEEMHARCWSALHSGAPSYRQEFRIIMPKAPIWLQEQVEIEVLGAHEWNLVGVVVDITRLKETENAMRVSEERNRLVLKASNDGIWDYDVVSNRFEASERCRDMLGLTPEEMPTNPEGWRVRIHLEDLAVEEAAWKKYRGTGEPCVYQARFRHRDGSWRWLMVRAMSIENEKGTLARIVGSHTDITELKRNDSELQQGRRLRAIGELVGGIAHEFNNLLTPMLLQTTMMRDGNAPGGPLKEQLRPVIGAITEARELTQRILAFGRKSSVNPEKLELFAVVNDNLELLRHTIDRRVKLDLHPAATSMWVLQNRTDVAQIIINLVLNARDTVLEKASGRAPQDWSPSIQIEFATLDKSFNEPAADSAEVPVTRWHELVVRDNGMGMTDDVRERIFEPFYTTKELGHGTGLGLATVWHLIKTMGGRVDVDTRVGAGSEFHVLLPAVDAPAGPAVPAQAVAVPPPAGKNARILLADDQPQVAATLGKILQRWGHTVTIAHDGTAALRMLASGAEAFDVCITDMNMPGATGFEVARAIRDRRLPLKIVIMGGYLTPNVRRTLLELKIEAIVPKPFSMDDIAAAMRLCGW